MVEIKLFSLIIPAFKQEKTIIKNIKDVYKALSEFSFASEIIIVVDGKSDNTYEKISRIRSKDLKSVLRVFTYDKNQGKGYAVKYGILKSRGDVVGFIDAGMDISSKSIPILIEYMKFSNADIVIGSKLHSDSRVKYPLVRKILSWGYRTASHLLFGFDVKDTQVGLKIFKREAALDIFPRILVKKFAFDIEMLAVAYSRGYKKIVEAPVKLNFKHASSVTSTNFWRIVLRTLWDTLAVYWRLKFLHYYDKIHR